MNMTICKIYLHLGAIDKCLKNCNFALGVVNETRVFEIYEVIMRAIEVG